MRETELEKRLRLELEQFLTELRSGLAPSNPALALMARKVIRDQMEMETEQAAKT